MERMRARLASVKECRSGEASWRTYSGKGMLIYSREDVLNIMLECRDGIKHAIATFTEMAEKHTAGETLQAVEQALLLRDAELVNALKTLPVTNVQVQIMSLFSALAMLGNISRGERISKQSGRYERPACIRSIDWGSCASH